LSKEGLELQDRVVVANLSGLREGKTVIAETAPELSIPKVRRKGP
jgi:hypothetical protein